MIVIIFGLPGTGKTTLAGALARHLDWPHFNTDMIRDELGKRQQYDQETKKTIYKELLDRAEASLGGVAGVILDGTFYREDIRKPFRDLGNLMDVPVKWIEIIADHDVVKERVSISRPYSEADYKVYLRIKEEFEPIAEKSLRVYSDGEEQEEMLGRIIQFIRE